MPLRFWPQPIGAVRRVPGPARRAGIALVLILAGMAFFLPSASAATFRTVIAQQASQPTPGQVVRVWVNSDTVFGETAGLEYNVGANFTRIACSFDTSYPGANWRCDIPSSVQTLGTFVQS